MLRKISCFCDYAISEEIPEEIDLDSDPRFIDQILDGSFLNFDCPHCGKKHKPEFDIKIKWISKNIIMEVFTELNRGEFYRRKKNDAAKNANDREIKIETVIGYPELADRLLVYRDGLEPIIMEAIKYYLYLKAEENYPEQDINIWYYGFAEAGSPAESPGSKSLEFHLHGIKENEVAVMKVPFSLYEKHRDEYKKNPKNDLFKALTVRTYTSVKNTMRHEALK